MNSSKLIAFTSSLDRSKFIDNKAKALSSFDMPLPIGYGQTISQPSLVFEMTLLLNVTKRCKVLEIGTGSGYQTAILSHFAKHVYTIELIPKLSNQAKKRLTHMAFTNITFLIGDGSDGVKQYAPYHRIIVTAAATKIPTALIDQLANNGIMIIPIGTQALQTLTLVKKTKTGKLIITPITKVRFVEFKGKYGWEKQP